MGTVTQIGQIGLSRASAKEILKELAEDSSNVHFVKHALDRMEEREIDTVQVLRIIGRGSIIEEPTEEIRGDWKCTLQGLSTGQRLTVCVAIRRSSRSVFIVTVY